MNSILISILIPLLSTISVQTNELVIETNQQRTGAEIRAGEVLKQASQIVLRQDKQRAFLFDRILLRIAELQVKARDFDGARHSIRNCGYDYGKNAAFTELAEALATAGQKEKAFEVIRELGTDHNLRQQDAINDNVRMCWIDYLINTDKLDVAQKAVGEFETSAARSEGLKKLALAYAIKEDKATANRLLKDATTSTTKISYEFCRAKALWEIVDAQLEAGANDSAAATVDQLVKISKTFKGGSTKVRALCEAGIRTARMKDREAAKRLFAQAIEAREMVDKLNKINSIKVIARAQVSAGLIDDALKTAAMIKHSESDFSQDRYREEVLFDVAVSQAKGGKLADAIATTITIEHFIQYQHDAFLAIMEQYIENGDLESALTTAKSIVNPTRKATAILKVATEYARSGDKNKAKEIAGAVQLKVSEDVIIFGEESVPFDFTNAETWGVLYDERAYFTGLSHSFTVNRAVELAAATMTLTQAISDSKKVDYADSFKDLKESVIESLARAHAIHGDDKEAFGWASRIGSAENAEPEDDYDKVVAALQRIHALAGVAEGLLEKHTRPAR